MRECAITEFAKHIVTSNRNIVSGIFNLHSNSSGNAVGNTAVFAKRSGCESMDTRSLHGDRDGIQALTRDFSIIHIPLIGISTHSCMIRYMNASKGTHANGILSNSKNRFHDNGRQNNNIDAVSTRAGSARTQG